VAYYLERHGLAPDEELAAHIQACCQAGDTSAETDSQTTVDAANFLLYPPPEHARTAAWTPGPAADPASSGAVLLGHPRRQLIRT
jgi:hypothetical protein